MQKQNDTLKIFNLYIKLGDTLTSDKAMRIYKLYYNGKPYNKKALVKKVEKIVNKLVNFYGEDAQQVYKEINDYLPKNKNLCY